MISWSEFQKKTYKFVHQQGRVCLHCSSFFVNDSLFCSVCENQLWQVHPKVSDFHEPGAGISGKALFSWYPDRDRQVSKLLLSLKGGRSRDAIDHYVARFCSQISSGKGLENAILVPCPSFEKVDHASVLAESFGRVLNLPVRRILKKERSPGPQKGLLRSLRFCLKMVAIEEIANRHVISELMAAAEKHRFLIIPKELLPNALETAKKKALAQISKGTTPAWSGSPSFV